MLLGLYFLNISTSPDLTRTTANIKLPFINPVCPHRLTIDDYKGIYLCLLFCSSIFMLDLEIFMLTVIFPEVEPCTHRKLKICF